MSSPLQGRPKKTHALRRTIFYGLSWGSLHVPLVGFIIVGAAGLLQCMEFLSEPSPSSVPVAQSLASTSATPESLEVFSLSSRWLMSAGFGGATLLNAVLGLASDEHPLLVRRRFSIPLRMAAGILTILLPLFVPETYAALNFLATVSMLVFFGAICSLVGGMRRKEKFQGLNINSALGGIFAHQ